MSSRLKWKKQLNHQLKIITLQQLGLILLFLIGCIYTTVTLISLINDHHFLYNLEPYPDGLLYSLIGRNLALGRGLQLVYDEQVLKSLVPTFYPIILSLGYLFNSAPATYVFINTILGLVTIAFLYHLLVSLTKSIWLGLGGIVIYLSHAYLWLLPTLPMTENLSLCLFIICLWLLFKSHWRLIEIIGFILALTALALSRFAAIPTSLVLFLLLVTKILRQVSGRQRIIFLFLLSLSGLMITGGLRLMGLDWLFIIKDFYINITKPIPSGHFSFAYVKDNLISYSQICLGLKAKFLWYRWPLTSLVLSTATLLSLINIHIKKQIRWGLFCLILAQFPLVLLLIGADARYLILLIPLLTIGTVLFWQMISAYLKRWQLFGLGSGLILLLLIPQLPIFKQILTANFFHRTRAWQYEAILNFNNFFQHRPDSTLISALPPFLVDAYQTSAYSLLPMSQRQEFLAKKEYVWGKNINYDDLMAEYQQRLAGGGKLYISNAYITHQWEVVADYEKLKQQFKLTKVADGCQDACNIYQLSLPTSALPNPAKSKNSVK